jgi:hypothetical protein
MIAHTVTVYVIREQLMGSPPQWRWRRKIRSLSTVVNGMVLVKETTTKLWSLQKEAAFLMKNM